VLEDEKSRLDTHFINPKMLTVYVSHFEDITSTIGEVVTIYCVNVNYSENRTYVLAKRYSDFADLYASVQELMSGTSYQFPNKSMFNNAAQFTKERRLRGFDELVKILSRMHIYAPDFHKFLEISERMSMLQESTSLHKPLRSKKPVTLTTSGSFVDVTDRITTDTPREKDDETDQEVHDDANEPSSAGSNGGTIDEKENTVDSDESLTPDEAKSALEGRINEKVKKKFSTISVQSIKVSVTLYAALFLSGVLDIYAVNLREVLFTCFALFLLVCYVFVIATKTEARSAEQVLINIQTTK
jgi:hypothetical protein